MGAGVTGWGYEGCTPEDLIAFARSQGAAARARYVSEVLATDDAADALERLRVLVEDGGVVLVCFEADGRCCHRTQVLQALDAAGPGS
jgi:hypothetical protein